MRPFLLFVLVSIITAACSSLQVASASKTSKPAVMPTSKVVLKSEVKWENLNPARGDKSPKAGTLWGDRNESGPTGFLIKPTDGFKSPPHIHNVSYRGVIISGLIHNDDPKAENMWMPEGSFWTQPKGKVHVTAAKGSNTTLAYIEIEEGPILSFLQRRRLRVEKTRLTWTNQTLFG